MPLPIRLTILFIWLTYAGLLLRGFQAEVKETDKRLDRIAMGYMIPIALSVPLTFLTLVILSILYYLLTGRFLPEDVELR